MKKLVYMNILLASICLTGTGGQVNAESTGWVNLAKFRKMDRMVYRQQNKIPVSIQCKPGKGKKHSRDAFAFKVEYQPNPGGVEYHWATGSAYRTYKSRWMKQGYKQVSYDKWVKDTGYVMHCAIFHKRK